MRLLDLPRPFLCAVLIDDRSPSELERTIKLCEAEGAQAFELDLQVLPPEHRTPEALGPVFESTACPVFTAYRRYDQSNVDYESLAPADDERIALMLELLDHGSAGFDMELDTFDPRPGPWFLSDEGLAYSHDPSSPPREVTYDAEADRRQRETIAEAHRRGGEVIASTHALTRLPVEAALEIGRLAQERGADIVKIVRLCVSRIDALETLAAAVALAEELAIPNVMMGTGEHGKLTRPLGPLFGSLLVFCRNTYSPGSFLEQPLIRSARAVLENADATIAPRTARFLPPELR